MRPFVAIADALRAEGYSTPKILAHNLEKGLLLLEDFGDRQFGDLMNDGRDPAPLYLSATELLADMAQKPPPKALPLPGGSSYQLPLYDMQAYTIELELLLDWFWPAIKGAQVPDELRTHYLDLWQKALAPVIEQSNHWALRDVHSPNLIWLDEQDGHQKVGLIDFQDAQRGHRAYDLVSLLQERPPHRPCRNGKTMP